MSHTFKVGEIIHGYASGVFGRDSYGCRRIEAVGKDWVVTRTIKGFQPSEGTPEFATQSDGWQWLDQARTDYEYCDSNDCQGAEQR